MIFTSTRFSSRWTSDVPVIDSITRKLTGAKRVAHVTEAEAIVHCPICGTSARAVEYVLPVGSKHFNTLGPFSIHNAAWHRDAIRSDELDVIRRLWVYTDEFSEGYELPEAEPTTEDMLTPPSSVTACDITGPRPSFLDDNRCLPYSVTVNFDGNRLRTQEIVDLVQQVVSDNIGSYPYYESDDALLVIGQQSEYTHGNLRIQPRRDVPVFLKDHRGYLGVEVAEHYWVGSPLPHGTSSRAQIEAAVRQFAADLKLEYVRSTRRLSRCDLGAKDVIIRFLSVPRCPSRAPVSDVCLCFPRMRIRADEP